MTTPITIERAMRDRNLLGAAFGDPASWSTWRVVLKAAFGLVPRGFTDPHERAQWESVAAGRKLPQRRVRELWCSIGRRGGKSRIAAMIGIYLACFTRHRLAPGEVGTVLILAQSQSQAGVVFRYCKAFLEASPVLAEEIASVTATEIRLKSGVVIAVHACSFRSVRGRTLLAVVADEISYWRDEASAVPDLEVYRAVLPSLATTKGMLVAISSPYRKAGLLYTKHRDHYGEDSDDILVVQGATGVFNPVLDEAEIAAQRAADPVSARSEWDAEFRDDLAGYLDDELIEGAIDRDRPLELPPRAGVFYRAFADPSGGVGHDSYTLCVAHKERDHRIVIDAVRGTKGKFDPQLITTEYAALLKDYRVRAVVGDRYSAEWCRGAWSCCGVTYTPSTLTKSELYLEAVPLFTRGLIRIPDHARLVRELRLLERRPQRSGRDVVDHPRNGHDDHANALAGAMHALSAQFGLDYSGFQYDAVGRDREAGVPPEMSATWKEWTRIARGQPCGMGVAREFVEAEVAAGRYRPPSEPLP